jgi:hypothetical protein
VWQSRHRNECGAGGQPSKQIAPNQPIIFVNKKDSNEAWIERGGGVTDS